MKRVIGWLVAGWLVSASVSAMDYSAEQLQILSELQVMAQGSYTEAEWTAVARRLDGVLEHARQNAKWDAYIDTQVIRANVMSMRGQDDQALALLQKTLSDFENSDVKVLRKVYVEIASLYARRGDQAAVTDIMNRFQKSRHFDRETYAFSGGYGPSDPIMVARPAAGVDGSISMTAMNVYRTQAEFGAGQIFPDFSATGWNGAPVTLASLRGTVVLVDFWSPGWFVWNRDLPNRIHVFNTYHGRGFEILGFSIDADEASARQFAQAKKIPWPQAVPPRGLLRTLGIFGEVTNFLIDRDGVIIGRNLYGAELDMAVRRAVAR
ncbi:MAG TPA: TlpA disulfide reductase family protein [Kiritimatiellia bacterium]|nr:TlpA disulfide reductase family protein [Kiritimatiellia bacterium]HMP32953.1 TlpA disulfide reductase family protein [Kiritimatiellia bacterium]